jgi:hypothetical protein
MRENELAACAKKAFRPRTTLPGGGASPNLIKGLEPSGVNQVWVSDITYIATLELGETLEAPQLLQQHRRLSLSPRQPQRQYSERWRSAVYCLSLSHRSCPTRERQGEA